MGVCLFLIVFGLYLSMSETNPMYQEKIHPFGIKGENISNITYFVGIVMIENSKDAIFMINEWEINGRPSNYTVQFTDPTTEVKFALKRWGMNESGTERIMKFGEMRHVPYEKIPYTKTLNTSPGTFIVRPSEIQNYFGLEAKVRNISRQVNPSQLSISVPLRLSDENEDLNEVSQIFVQLIPPKNFVLVTSMPQPNLYRLIENNSVAYQFEVDTRKTDLFILFENMFVTRSIQISQIVLGMLLSLATYLMANGFLNIISPIKSKIIKPDHIAAECSTSDERTDQGLQDQNPEEVMLLKMR
jgi:hypothetical protein